MAKHILKLTEADCAFKIYGPGGTTETIDLSTDLISKHLSGVPKEKIIDGMTPHVVISGITWTGAPDAVMTITRGGVIVASLQANAAAQHDFSGQGMVPDNVNETDDLVCTISASQFEAWIRLQKVSGYSSTHEYHMFGAYDNPNKVGE